MGDKIKFDPKEFEDKISKFSTGGTDLSMDVTDSISETDIEPYTSFKTVQQSLSQFLGTYQSLIESDVTQMKSIGAALVETDKRIGGKK
ncbi:TIGR04197 family type VII secretion effector [Enterococcus sp. AZ101]|uniref:TIGR04197 family type VII secretion effector n=1 Tax=Enterococcus sp. AZ101 TaxID=2774742 RepID=UPI003D26AFCD